MIAKVALFRKVMTCESAIGLAKALEVIADGKSIGGIKKAVVAIGVMESA